jgi:hypothetical protein
MDERVPFVGKLLEGESMTEVCRESGSRARPATRSSSVTGKTALKRCPTGRGGSSIDARSGRAISGGDHASKRCCWIDDQQASPPAALASAVTAEVRPAVEGLVAL